MAKYFQLAPFLYPKILLYPLMPRPYGVFQLLAKFSMETLALSQSSDTSRKTRSNKTRAGYMPCPNFSISFSEIEIYDNFRDNLTIYLELHPVHMKH